MSCFESSVLKPMFASFNEGRCHRGGIPDISPNPKDKHCDADGGLGDFADKHDLCTYGKAWKVRNRAKVAAEAGDMTALDKQKVYHATKTNLTKSRKEFVSEVGMTMAVPVALTPRLPSARLDDGAAVARPLVP